MQIKMLDFESILTIKLMGFEVNFEWKDRKKNQFEWRGSRIDEIYLITSQKQDRGRSGFLIRVELKLRQF